MRYNDKDLAKLSEAKADLEGVLQHLKPQGNEWSDWYQQASFKERRFKLISNLLFYYRINEDEPLGVLVLENAQVAYERLHKGNFFAFSITFKLKDRRDGEAKHVFCCRCDEDVSRWVAALKTHSYEYWRNQFHILKTKISMKTGQDPILDFMRTCAVGPDYNKATKRKNKSTFYTSSSSSVFETSFSETRSLTKTEAANQKDAKEENLILF